MRLAGARKTIPNQPLTLASAVLQHAGRQFLQERYATPKYDVKNDAGALDPMIVVER
jgi:hypothetical protein